MIKLILGLILWWAGHLLKRLAPGVRRDMTKALGEGPAKGIIGLVLMAAAALIVLGFWQAEPVWLYTPLPGIGHLTNILMLASLFLMGVGPAGGRMSAMFRHPMLWGLFLWSVSHLLVNGDSASVVLFGGLGLWVPVQIRLINQHEGAWERPMPGDSLQDWKLGLGVLFMYCVIAGIHWLFGINVFAGTYG